MGCCVVKDDKLSQENQQLIINFNKKMSSQFKSETTVFEKGFQDKTPLSMEYARSFFRHKGSTTDINGSNDAYKSDSIGHFLKKEKINEEAEFKEKINFEEEKKNRKESLNFCKDKGELIPYPRLEFSLMNTRLTNVPSEKIIITPNSINGSVRQYGEKFFFGKTSSTFTGNHLSVHLPMPKFSSTSLNTRANDYDFADDSIGPRQFEVSYSKEKGKFHVVDNKRGTGLFVKIKQSVVVDHDMIVSFCASHMILQVESEPYHPENKIIKIRFLQGPHQNQEKVFNSKDKKIIRIGRSKQAEVVYKDDSVSRIQCTVVYEKGNWNLYDGYLDNGSKGSTNGIWLLASSKIELTDEMVLKTGNTALVVKIKESE